MLKRIIKWSLLAFGAVLLGLFAFVARQASAYDASISKVYDVPLPALARSTDPAVIERGRHLAESLGACTLCHGAAMSGGQVKEMGPLGHVVVPNVTEGKGARGTRYTDAELGRLIKHGIKRDGTTVRLMPSQDYVWWPEEDVIALISWLRTQPAVDGDPGVFDVNAMAKVLDRYDSIPIDVARRIDHSRLPEAPKVAATAEYGAAVGTSCRGCHGPNLSGGPIPGAPPDLPVPLNLTPHPSGLNGWTFDDFKTVLSEGRRKNGKPLARFMPYESLRKMNDTELHALWAYLQSVPARPFGEH